MNLLKKYFIWVPLLMACNSSHNESFKKNESSEIADKVLINGPIREELLAKDTAIINYLKAFNEIQENLDSIKSKEKIITLNSSKGEVLKPVKDMIINDIKLIYDLLNKNRETMALMKKKLEDSQLKDIEIEKININLIKQVSEKESEINALKYKLDKLNIELNYLNLSDGKEKELEKKNK